LSDGFALLRKIISWYFVKALTKYLRRAENEKRCPPKMMSFLQLAAEKLLKFEAEGREFSKKIRSLEQFIQTF
jgi:hypothetical protein